MLIRNYGSLATSRQRRLALQIIDAGISSVLVRNAVRDNVSLKNNVLTVKNMKFPLSRYRKIYVVGFGKASIATARELERILKSRITGGIVLDVSRGKLQRIKVRKCSHPVTSSKNVRATKELIKILSMAKKDDLILCLVSGGGSAILEYPDVPLPSYIRMNKALLRAGADIHEMNIVRKHISRVKGDQLLCALKEPAAFIALIESDVVGDDLAIIASGPTVYDKSTKIQAERIISRYRLPKIKLHETPKVHWKNVHNILLLTNKVALAAMKKKSLELGLRAKVLTNKLEGEAREVGEKLAAMVRPGMVVLAAGETTVTVRGTGIGGRNQELVLGALARIDNAVVVSCGTDGIDNSPAAGGIVDIQTLAKAAKKNIYAQEYLDNNDSHTFLKKTGDAIMTGPTGTNVADIMLVLKL